MNNDDWFSMMNGRMEHLLKQDRRIGLLVEAMVKTGLNRRGDQSMLPTLKMAIKQLCRGLPYEWSKITNKGWTVPIPEAVLEAINEVSAQVEAAFDSIIENGEFIPIFVLGSSCKVDPVDNIRQLARQGAKNATRHLMAAYRGGLWDGKTVDGLPELVGTPARMLERGHKW
jgi:hypothetical protein